MKLNKPALGKPFDLQKPVLTKTPEAKRPVLGKGFLDDRKWSFSFKYFGQDRYFGLGDSEPKWFVSLLERLKDLSTQNIDSFLSDYGVKDAYRFHKIDWNATNIPIHRKDINWVDKNIIDNEGDYPFFQFQVSKGKGRVVGFWEPGYDCFYIVLLDSKHNLQPSKDYDYKVNDTVILHCQYTALMLDIDRVKGIQCAANDCRCKNELTQIPKKSDGGNVIYFKIADDYLEEFHSKTKHKSLKEIIELGLLAAE
jgi:hypothetical protein